MKRHLVLLGWFFATGLVAQEAADKWIQQGMTKESQGDLKGALASYDKAIAADGENVSAYLARGIANHNLGNLEAADADLSKALEKNDQLSNAWVHRGMVRWDLGQWEKGASDVKRGVAITPKVAVAWFYLGLEAYRNGKWDEAVKQANRGLGIALRHPGLTCLRGMAKLKKGDTDDAYRDLRRASQLESNFPMALLGLSQVYAKKGQKVLAQRYRDMACAIDMKFAKKNPDRNEETTWIRHGIATDFPGYCMCCRLSNQENKHDEADVLKRLAARGEAQEKLRSKLKVVNDFTFEDRYFESGILFENQAVDDSTRDWKPVHYDHGNGLAVADVDGDGHLDLYFVSQLGGNALWRNLGDGTFEDITDKAGVALVDQVGVAASFADADNDGDPDLYVTTVRKGNHFFENTGGGVFKDITKQAGLTHVGHSSGAVFFDYDNDGRLDLLLTNVGVYTNDQKQPAGNYVGLVDAFSGQLKPDRYEKSLIYHNEGGLKFKDVTEALGFNEVGFAGDATIVDINGDGFQDVYVLNMQGDDHFYLNQGGKKLVEQTDKYFPKTPWGAMGVKFFDANNDGLPDLYITDMHSDMSANVYPRQEKDKSNMTWSDEFLQGGANNIFGNAYYRNPGKAPLKEASDALGLENYWPWGLSSGDLNADGYQDLFVASSMNYPFRYAVNSVFLNNGGGGFVDSEFMLGIEPRKRTVKPWFALDCDGADAGNPICKDRKGLQMVWGAYGSRSSAIFDLDEDGDLDIVTNEFNSHPMVLISNLAEKQKIHYLRIQLSGTESNRNGIGAKVQVTAGGRTLTQFRDGKSGYLSQSIMPLYFGLGDVSTVDKVEVLWPSGKKQVIDTSIPINQTLKLQEPESK